MTDENQDETLVDDGQIPSDAVAIGGNAECSHSTYRQIGSDGGANIYFNCTDCSRVILKFATVGQDDGPEDVSPADNPELYPDRDTTPAPDPLGKGLSLDSDGSGEGPPSPGEMLQRLRGAVKKLFGSNGRR